MPNPGPRSFKFCPRCGIDIQVRLDGTLVIHMLPHKMRRGRREFCPYSQNDPNVQISVPVLPVSNSPGTDLPRPMRRITRATPSLKPHYVTDYRYPRGRDGASKQPRPYIECWKCLEDVAVLPNNTLAKHRVSGDPEDPTCEASYAPAKVWSNEANQWVPRLIVLRKVEAS